MSLAAAFDSVLEIANAAAEPTPAWTALVAYLESRTSVTFEHLRNVNVRHDVDDLRRQLQALVTTEPPPDSIDAIYFGLFDSADRDRNEGIGFYAAGIEAYDPNNGNSLCRPAWWPKGRYLSSVALNAIKAAELAARASTHRDSSSFLGYAGQLGAALILAKFSSLTLFGGRRRLVGFDSGDVAELVA